MDTTAHSAFDTAPADRPAPPSTPANDRRLRWLIPIVAAIALLLGALVHRAGGSTDATAEPAGVAERVAADERASSDVGSTDPEPVGDAGIAGAGEQIDAPGGFDPPAGGGDGPPPPVELDPVETEDDPPPPVDLDPVGGEQPSGDLSAGEGVGGCAGQCITMARLTPNVTTPNVGLEVRTLVPATIRVAVSTQPPFMVDDAPELPGGLPPLLSPQPVTEWSTVLMPLDPGTEYHVVVRATDEDGDVSHRVGSFTTVTPAGGAGSLVAGGAEPGCAHQCITTATIAPGDGLDPSHLTVASHTPARFQLQLSAQAPVEIDGVPTIEEPEVWENSGLEYREAWEVDLVGLAPGTTYHAVLQAIDANGSAAHATGAFTTDSVDVRIVLHDIHITQDGDPLGVDAGELTFSWGTADQLGAISAETKRKAGQRFAFDFWDSQLDVHDATGHLPAVYVEVSERDADADAHLCSMGNAPAREPGSSDECDSRWNVAWSGHLVHVRDLDGGMRDCTELGFDAAWAGVGCLRIEGEDLGEQYPEFWTILSYHVL